ncbi:polyphosphate polymerase domain-containing protein [Shewanella holmiensis]|uniref:Polyphosphate polymerase domain-containing protein n=1 Tax=Shewanella holmiensis TaxID=2952222 RepID=A0A9X3AK51_9GAMM|nr:polyphosphate polymerase domain-containing protein [Shewanella holmiensis]MCT7940367.1 polyphosphate polymerase domain-containing protein [Shewanella holmiensis]
MMNHTYDSLFHRFESCFERRNEQDINAQVASNLRTSLTNVDAMTDPIATLIMPELIHFQCHGLDDLKNAKLMNRVDSKFILPIAFLPKLLGQLTHFYSILEINNNRISTYHNQYFDTPSMALYKDHHNGKLNRYKVRRRHYVNTDTQFLEVKFKNNQKRTLKSRIQLTGHSNEGSEFVEQQMGSISSNLQVNQHSGYQRIALANEAQAERLTIDFNLWYQHHQSTEKLTLPGFFIAELKQAKKSKRSPFYQLMSANNIFPLSFSKYCIGCALLNTSSVKTNRFKPILSRIEKLNQPLPLTTFMSN